MARGQSPGFSGRMLCSSETTQPDLVRFTLQIRVPPLRVRRSDLGAWLGYLLLLKSSSMGWTRPPQLPESVVRRLQNHDFANNLRELDDLMKRALRQVRQRQQTSLPEALPEEMFWLDNKTTRHRFDLWRWRPALRYPMRSPRLWNGLLFGLVSWLFIAVNLALWLGPQTLAQTSILKLF